MNARFLNTVSYRGMSPIEMKQRRLMRAPDGHGGGEGGAAFDFPDTVTALDAVPDKFRGFYEPVEGGSGFKFADVTALKGALANAKAERATARAEAAQAKQFRELGLTPEEIAALKAEKAAADETKAKAAGDWDSLKAQMETNHAAALAAKDARTAKLEKALHKALISDRAQRALADPEIEGNPLFLLPHIDGRVKLDETDDGFVTVVLREDGTPLLNASNQPATLKDLFLSLKEKPEFAPAFKGVNQNGGGASNNNGGGGAPTGTKARLAMTPQEKTAYITKHGIDGYNKLPLR